MAQYGDRVNLSIDDVNEIQGELLEPAPDGKDRVRLDNGAIVLVEHREPEERDERGFGDTWWEVKE